MALLELPMTYYTFCNCLVPEKVYSQTVNLYGKENKAKGKKAHLELCF
jgi:hypothetical protein